jgi:hypothetical protein
MFQRLLTYAGHAPEGKRIPNGTERPSGPNACPSPDPYIRMRSFEQVDYSSYEDAKKSITPIADI